MRAEIITIGEELLCGALVDTNAARLSEWLELRSVEVRRHQTVGDREEEIIAALKGAVDRSDLILLTGGLGPTEDDRTRYAIARLAGVDLQLDRSSWNAITDRFALMGKEPPESNRCQALIPEGAVVLENTIGTAPGFSLRVAGAEMVALPGVPREIDVYLEGVLDRHAQASGWGGAEVEILRTRVFGLSESALSDRIRALKSRFPEDTDTRYRVDRGEIQLEWRHTPSSEEDRQAFHRAIEEARESIGSHRVADDSRDVGFHCVQALRNQRLTLSVAEGCTGGLVAHLLTRNPGASEILLSSVVAYSNREKMRTLALPEELLERHGVVSEEVVTFLARSVRERSGSDLGLAVVGYCDSVASVESERQGEIWCGISGPLGMRSRCRRMVLGRDLSGWVAAKFAVDQIRRYLLAQDGTSVPKS
ncbi:MAG: CinA family nicotinamide mononucleotide deamidase-related protein [Planctomycetota bacterium]|jgi:nicotinamide-nucleotide amidase|nr:CinA family nicotinamide mononucleotide deamidase-related protein [Planctomycetota bacterium]